MKHSREIPKELWHSKDTFQNERETIKKIKLLIKFI